MTIFKEVRINNEKTQQQMANILDVPLRRYQSYERGERTPSYEVLMNILNLRGRTEDKKLASILKDLINEKGD